MVMMGKTTCTGAKSNPKDTFHRSRKHEKGGEPWQVSEAKKSKLTGRFTLDLALLSGGNKRYALASRVWRLQAI